MKHLATIQIEFLKEARKWNDFTLEDQKAYLGRHPKSKRKLTAIGKSKVDKNKKHDKKDLPKDSQTGKTITATKFTKQELFDAAKKAGTSLFKKHHTGLVFGAEEPDDLDFEKTSLKKQQSVDEDEEGDYVDEYEYVFFPSTGKGLDVSSESWKKAKKSWADKDGNIYTCWAGDSIIITTT
jgi:hypothetical protein